MTAVASEKYPVDVELFLAWTYQYQMIRHDGLFALKLPKLAVPGWVQMIDLGTEVDTDRKPRLPVREGPPHPDALKVDFAVRNLPEVRTDWWKHRHHLLGDLAGWVTEARPVPAPVREARLISMTSARSEIRLPPPIEVSPIGFVQGHAILGNRPPWDVGRPQLRRGTPALIGRQTAKDKYTAGSCCPLTFDPPLEKVAEARFEYMMWHDALIAVARASVDMRLESFALLPPSAPAAPWRSDPLGNQHSIATSSRMHSPSIVSQNFS